MTNPEEFTAQPDGIEPAHSASLSEQRYRALVRATSSLVWTTAPDGQIIDMPEWRAYTGQSVEQNRGWGWLNALHPGDRERTSAVWQKAVDTRSLYETEYRIRRRDGMYIWHQARGVAILEADGSIREWVGICLDIELRKRAAERQIEAEKSLRRLNENLEQRVEAEARERARIWNVSLDMLVVADAEGRYLNVNPAWTSTLGWSETDLVGNTSEWLLHPDDRAKTRAELARVAKGDTTLRFENRLRRKDGSFRWLSWTAVPDRGLIYAVARDMTELKAAEDGLRTSRLELARTSRRLTMGALSASITHEISQPIAAMAANANAALRWLVRTTPDLDETRLALQRIVHDGQVATDVIKGIRAMFKADAETRASVHLNALMREVLVLAQGERPNQPIEVHTELDESLPPVTADRVQLRQVMFNLVTNAIDAMDSVVGRNRILRVKSELSGSDGIIVTVEDSDTGIAPENIDRIFDTFFTTKTNGMGMGLAICRSIVESHGGTLSASPGYPHGATFRIVLPVGAPHLEHVSGGRLLIQRL
jgi:PAS domain S-box-containing protein